MREHWRRRHRTSSLWFHLDWAVHNTIRNIVAMPLRQTRLEWADLARLDQKHACTCCHHLGLQIYQNYLLLVACVRGPRKMRKLQRISMETKNCSRKIECEVFEGSIAYEPRRELIWFLLFLISLLDCTVTQEFSDFGHPHISLFFCISMMRLSSVIAQKNISAAPCDRLQLANNASNLSTRVITR